MFCRGCGNPLNDDALFCPKCGQKTGKQKHDTGVDKQPAAQPAEQPASQSSEQPIVQPSTQPNTPYVNDIDNVKTEKRKSKAPIIITSVVAGAIGCFAVVVGGLFWIGSRSSNDVDTGAAVSSTAESNVPDGNVSGASAQDSIDELIGYIDQAEELVTKTYSDLEALLNGEDYSTMFRNGADILENAISDLSDLQNQADAVKGIDANLENAKNEYFNLMYNAQTASFEVWSFYADYLDFYANVIVYRPQTEYYDAMSDYYYDLNDWYVSAQEGYSAIDCPSCLESEWKQYKDILDLNYSIVDKLYNAEQYGDFLRFQSAVNMSARYDAVEEAQSDEFLDCLSGEQDFFEQQWNLASDLADEIHSYAELGEDERSGYEFEFVRPGEITLSYDAVDTIYPSLYNTYDAFVIVKTGCLSGSKTILVEAEIPGLTQNYKESFTLGSAYRAIYIKPPALTGDLDLSSSKDAQMNVTISEQDGTLIEAKTFPITIQSKYDFDLHRNEYGVATKDNYLCFLTPESSAISQLKRQAIEEISDMTNGQMESFVGYQTFYSNNYVNTYIQAAGLMRALYENGVRYNMDPFSINDGHQHVLLPEDVLEQKSGLCIETSLVVASALQSAGMHAFIVCPTGHAQVAVEIWDGHDGNMEGVGEYFLIETTALSNNNNNRDIFIDNALAFESYENLGTSSITYYNQEGWYNYIINNNAYIIDCDDSRVLGLTPFAN